MMKLMKTLTAMIVATILLFATANVTIAEEIETVTVAQEVETEETIETEEVAITSAPVTFQDSVEVEAEEQTEALAEEAVEEAAAEEITETDAETVEETAVEAMEEIVAEETATEEKAEFIGNATIRVLGDSFQYGDTITLEAELTGYENVGYTLQWECSEDGEEWFAAPGDSNGLTYQYTLDEANAVWNWRLAVEQA